MASASADLSPSPTYGAKFRPFFRGLRKQFALARHNVDRDPPHCKYSAIAPSHAVYVVPTCRRPFLYLSQLAARVGT